MSENEILERLLSDCDQQTLKHNTGTLSFVRKNIVLDPTRILETWEKDANLPLPEKICFSRGCCTLQIDRSGVKLNGVLTSWSKIKMNTLAVHHINGCRIQYFTENYFMARLSEQKSTIRIG